MRPSVTQDDVGVTATLAHFTKLYHGLVSTNSKCSNFFMVTLEYYVSILRKITTYKYVWINHTCHFAWVYY